jgi:hypothetical protein
MLNNSEITSLSSRRLLRKASMIAHCEWISLGVLALEEAERAHAANDAFVENYYVMLARKCDACADQVWLATKGNFA